MNNSPEDGAHEPFAWWILSVVEESWYLTILLGILVSEVFILIIRNNFRPRMPRAIHIKKESSIWKALYWNLRRETCTKFVAVQQCSKTTSRTTCKQGLKIWTWLCSDAVVRLSWQRRYAAYVYKNQYIAELTCLALSIPFPMSWSTTASQIRNPL
jgi:hypothetical protein